MRSTEYEMDNFLSVIIDPNGKKFIDNSAFKFNTFPQWVKSRYGEEYMIRDDTANTPDIISYMKYGRSDLWWIICLANSISDPFTELQVGTVILLPQIKDVKEYINSITKTSDEAGQIGDTIALN